MILCNLWRIKHVLDFVSFGLQRKILKTYAKNWIVENGSSEIHTRSRIHVFVKIVKCYYILRKLVVPRPKG